MTSRGIGVPVVVLSIDMASDPTREHEGMSSEIARVPNEVNLSGWTIMLLSIRSRSGPAAQIQVTKPLPWGGHSFKDCPMHSAMTKVTNVASI